jgi:hypothetical protein
MAVPSRAYVIRLFSIVAKIAGDLEAALSELLRGVR